MKYGKLILLLLAVALVPAVLFLRAVTLPPAISFIEPSAQPLTFPSGSGGDVYAVVSGDFNSDGKLDVAVTRDSSGFGASPYFVSVLLGNGDGTFQNPIDLSVPVSSGSDQLAKLHAADFDGDGKLDILAEVYGQNAVYFYKGHGDGNFDAPVMSIAGLGPDRGQVADLDGDGKLDFVFVSYATAQVVVMLGNGDGTFQAPTFLLTPNMNPNVVRVADVNSDGKLDLLVGGSNSFNLYVFLNQGVLGFPPTPASYDAGTDIRDMGVGDFDSDGRLDVAANGYRGIPNLVVIKGNGDGTFQSSPPDSAYYPIESQPQGFY